MLSLAALHHSARVSGCQALVELSLVIFGPNIEAFYFSFVMRNAIFAYTYLVVLVPEPVGEPLAFVQAGFAASLLFGIAYRNNRAFVGVRSVVAAKNLIGGWVLHSHGLAFLLRNG